MSDRKLASVRRIADISEIPGADQIVCVTVDGWKLVSNKENGFKVNDLVIYFEIDSFLPVIPQFEWMRDRCFKSTTNLGDGFRVRTIKLRGQVSQGLIVPLADFCTEKDGDFYVEVTPDPPAPDLPVLMQVVEGSDLTSFIGVQKYETPIPAQLAGQVRGTFPSFIFKTDQERVQNCWSGIQKWMKFDKDTVTEVDPTANTVYQDQGPGQYEGYNVFESDGHLFVKTRTALAPEVSAERSKFEATLKLDGSSMTVYYNKGQLGVCSRNMDLERNIDNSFWKVAVTSGLVGTLAQLGKNIAIQGELMGPGVQGNRENLPDHMMFVFDVFDIDEQRRLTPTERHALVDALYDMGTNENIVAHVPVLSANPFMDVFDLSNQTIETLLVLADKQASISHPIAEGIVFKSLVKDGPTFKAISNKFLLKEKD